MDDLAQSSKLLIARLPNMGLGRDMPTNAVLRRVMVHMATIADFQDSDRHPAAEEPNLHGPPAPASRGSTPRLEPSQKSLSRSGTEVGLLGPLSEPLAGCVLLPGSDFRKSTRNSTRGSPEAEDQDDEAKEDASAADGENGNWWTSEDDGASIRSSEISCPPCAQPPQPWVPPPPSLPIDEERQRRHDVAVRTMLEPDMLEMFCAITLILERRPGFCMPRYDDVLPLLGQIWRAAAPRQTRYDVSVPYAGEPAHLSPLPEPELPSASSIASQASWDALRVPTPNSTPPRTGLSGVRRDGSNVELLMPSPPSSPRAGLSSVSRDDRSTTVRPLDEGTSVLMAPGTGDHESEGVSVMRAGDSPVEPSTRPGKRRHGSENGDGDGDEPVVGRRKKKKTAGPSPKVDKGKGRAYND
ncbi:uncharacterized protein PHACADRAFT_261223 [Phanerochaete carnosa HHB-10118-sp]|uniref:Uncharacterized protein n=1 Tax=Phanerochaete carnosa (strain HHB-10118-sp) TaxID=650164 RepID=K5VMF3_PHACS|nr:uncharacterized protein PHACADRAFT_261223 [Phanerochaete carnosa HHB-10118-sp]EKM52648.1 hypothetical protein PHACADRAFT_261223 [Phanerochaete carnosa HHB-10118-sp]